MRALCNHRVYCTNNQHPTRTPNPRANARFLNDAFAALVNMFSSGDQSMCAEKNEPTISTHRAIIYALFVPCLLSGNESRPGTHGARRDASSVSGRCGTVNCAPPGPGLGFSFTFACSFQSSEQSRVQVTLELPLLDPCEMNLGLHNAQDRI